MPIYKYACPVCKFEEELYLTFSEYDVWIEALPTKECPVCKHIGLDRIIGLPIIRSEIYLHERKMKSRFKKRNKKLEAMPKPQQARMKKFMDKHNVRKEW